MAAAATELPPVRHRPPSAPRRSGSGGPVRLPSAGSRDVPPRVGSGRRLVRQHLASLRGKQERLLAEQRRVEENLAIEWERKERLRLDAERVADQERYDEALHARMMHDEFRQSRKKAEKASPARPRRTLGDAELGGAKSAISSVRNEMDDLHRSDYIEREANALRLRKLQQQRGAGRPSSAATGLPRREDLIQPPVHEDREWRCYMRDWNEINKLELVDKRDELGTMRISQLRKKALAEAKQEAEREAWLRCNAERVLEMERQGERSAAANRAVKRQELTRLINRNRDLQRARERAEEQAQYAMQADTRRMDSMSGNPGERRRVEDMLLRQELAKAVLAVEARETDQQRSLGAGAVALPSLQSMKEEERKALAASRRPPSASRRPPLPFEGTALAAPSGHARALASLPSTAAALAPASQLSLSSLKDEEKTLVRRRDALNSRGSSAGRARKGRPSSGVRGRLERRGSGRRRAEVEQERKRLAEEAEKRREALRAEEARLEAEGRRIDAAAERRQHRYGQVEAVRRAGRLLCDDALQRKDITPKPCATPPPATSPPPTEVPPPSNVGPWLDREPLRVHNAQRQAAADARRAYAEELLGPATEAVAGDSTNVLNDAVKAELLAVAELEKRKQEHPDAAVVGSAVTHLARRIQKTLLWGCSTGACNNPSIALAVAIANATGPPVRLCDTFYFDDSSTACRKAGEILPAGNIVQLVSGLQGKLLAVALDRLVECARQGAHPGLLCFDFYDALGEVVAQALEGGPGREWAFAGDDHVVGQLQRLQGYGWRFAWVTLEDDDDALMGLAEVVAQRQGVKFDIFAHGQAVNEARVDTAFAMLVEMLGPSGAAAMGIRSLKTSEAFRHEAPPPPPPEAAPEVILTRGLAHYRRSLPRAFTARFERAYQPAFGSESKARHAPAVQWILKMSAELPEEREEKRKLEEKRKRQEEMREEMREVPKVTEEETGKLARLEERVGKLGEALEAERKRQRDTEAARRKRLQELRTIEDVALEEERDAHERQVKLAEDAIADHKRVLSRLQKGLEEIAVPGENEGKKLLSAAAKLQAYGRALMTRVRLKEEWRPKTPPSRGSSLDWCADNAPPFPHGEEEEDSPPNDTEASPPDAPPT
eukprot:Hpha_TRINITY_DN16672_c0_g2::TRINITY_DN16672_c0_g2_i1::g.178915::m.178915